MWHTLRSRGCGCGIKLLAVPAVQTPTSGRRTSRADLAAAVGLLIDGEFELIRPIGTGSHADVFLARQRSVANRLVAIKSLSYLYMALSERDIKKAGQALLREGELLGGLRSPCFVDIYRCGALPDSRPYVAMEFAEGHTLQDVIASLNSSQKRMTDDRVAEIIDQWSQGLAELHAAGWVHRDVTPANAAVADGPSGEVRLKTYDLGTATQVQEKADRFRIGWDKENPAGTPAYMAPEQARGDTVDGRADQYSLGCIAYELLTGQRPLGNQGVRAAEVLEFLRSDRPIPHQPLGNLRADLAPEVEAAVHRALARDPDQRYGNIRQFGQTLAQALHLGSSPRQTWWSRLWRRPAERRNGGSQ